MKIRNIVLAVSLGLGTAAMATPPAHAPAHGYRMKHQGTELVFDRDLEVYVVEDREDTFFLDGTYYTFRDGQWMAAVDLDDPAWDVVEVNVLPRALVMNRTPDFVDGPPAHAQARGHGKTHGDYELNFDEDLQVHVVEGRDGVYFHEEAFFTVQDGVWVRTYELQDPQWEMVEIDLLPRTLVEIETPELAFELDPDVDLTFDEERQVYIVEGRDGIYFHDGAFFRVENDTWVRAYELDAPDWEVVEVDILPPPLIELETPELALNVDID